MGYYRIINGVRWYYRLKPLKEANGRIKRGLFNDKPRHTLSKNLIVRLTYQEPGSDKVFKLFTVFKSYLEYGIYQLKLPQHERCFFEIVLGESTQKPHFDIDIENTSVDGEAVKDNLLDSIIKVLNEKNVKLDLGRDILIYTSHGHGKQSYHVVVNNYCHANNVEARAFYDNIMDHVNPEFVG